MLCAELNPTRRPQLGQELDLVMLQYHFKLDFATLRNQPDLGILLIWWYEHD